jgi:hypothetical protein
MYSYRSYRTPCENYMVCQKCVNNDIEDRQRQAADPKTNETMMVCAPGSFLSSMVTTDAVTDVPPPNAAALAFALGGIRLGLTYSLTVEFALPLLPPRGQRLALLRCENGRHSTRRETTRKIFA